MATPAVRSIILIRFPFSDLSRSKLRPALVLAKLNQGDYICCQITSKRYASPLAITLEHSDFVVGGLERASFIRPEKLFTANNSLIDREVGKIALQKRSEVSSTICRLVS